MQETAPSTSSNRIAEYTTGLQAQPLSRESFLSGIRTRGMPCGAQAMAPRLLRSLVHDKSVIERTLVSVRICNGDANGSGRRRRYSRREQQPARGPAFFANDVGKRSIFI